ncbi:FluC/FEX family fluoride channel [Demequina maris]|uniref:FluC/FEX family fluoride channel n=1 Tax=Demequina maris TaxID=1638982 RepID=UPI0007838C4C|nr:CrcB family protein [Demequina maris]
MTGWAYAAAILGCGLGACVRFSLGWLDRRRTFPWPTILANVLGAALLGAVVAAGDDALLSPGWAFALGTGVAGGLSTFSSLAVDIVVMLKDRRHHATAQYVLATCVLGMGAAGAGFAVVTALS